MPKNILFILLLTFLLASCSNASDFGQQAQLATKTTAQPDDSAFWKGSTANIWNKLQHMSLQKLELASADHDSVEEAWIKLAIISKRYNHDSQHLVQQLLMWRYQYPDHPGNTLFNSNSTFSEVTQNSAPRHIALLLPLHGTMASSGQAVRDGFLDAYYQSLTNTQDKQTISFYDTSTQRNMAALYQQAIQEGAETIIGPLIKEDVQNLLNSTSISVPTLALNYTEGSLPAHLYEFGLSPLDEAHQVAEKAHHDGLARAIVIAPQTAWGQRVANNLISSWKSLGGQVSDTLYFAKNTDLNQAIPKLLHIDTAEDRKKMRQNNHKTELAQQRRQDFDVIFLLAEPQAGREIVPLLKYYYADHTPIYATSMIYSGVPNPQKDHDLNGIIFPDIPWFLKSSHHTNRLYAVGHDAFIISSELKRMAELPQFPLYAATGALILNSNHQIYRRLPWAKIHDGHP